MVRLTEMQRRELTVIGRKRPFGALGIADNLRIARDLERKGLITLVREWTEGTRGQPGRDFVMRKYVLTPAGRKALEEGDG